MSFFNNTASSTGENSEYTTGPGSGTHSEAFNQSQDRGAYSEMQSSQGSDDMGGGRGTMGSGVAGGYGGTSGNQQQVQGEKKDWLDKGISALGDKFGVKVVSASVNASFPCGTLLTSTMRM